MYELSEHETFLKKLYIDNNKYSQNHPIDFEKYKILTSNYTELSESNSLFINNTKCNLGTTLLEVEKISNGDSILAFIANRYNPPILHNHSYIEIIYVLNGSCTHFIEDKEYEMNSGDICILAPNALHAISTKCDDDIIINILLSKSIFTFSYLKILDSQNPLFNFIENILYNKKVSPYILFNTGNDVWIHENIMKMVEESSNKPYAYKECLELCTQQLFIHLNQYYGKLSTISNSIDSLVDNDINAILGYISINHATTSLKELASIFNYSETYLSKLLKKYTGKTFMTIITEYQMKHAKNLIENGYKNMTEISQQVGCFDASHLVKKFKKIYGISPFEYKKHIK